MDDHGGEAMKADAVGAKREALIYLPGLALGTERKTITGVLRGSSRRLIPKQRLVPPHGGWSGPMQPSSSNRTPSRQRLWRPFSAKTVTATVRYSTFFSLTGQSRSSRVGRIRAFFAALAEWRSRC